MRERRLFRLRRGGFLRYAHHREVTGSCWDVELALVSAVSSSRLGRAFGPYTRSNSSHSKGAGYDLPLDEIQGLRGRRGKAQERNQRPSESPGGTFFRILKSCLRIYQGLLSRRLEKSSVAARGLRAGEPVPTTWQPPGPAKGVVSPEAEKRPHRDENVKQQHAHSDRKLPHNHLLSSRHYKITRPRRGSLDVQFCSRIGGGSVVNSDVG